MNFRRILPKSSSRSTVTSGKSLPYNREVTKLQSEIESLKQTVEALKVSVASKEAAIGTLAREKEKLYLELKSAQRTNRNLHQQLIDERDIHAKEKDFFVEELTRLTRKNESQSNLNGPCYESNYSSYEEQLKAKDEVICNICNKYLKMKASKYLLQKKLDAFELQTQKVCENIISLLQENKRSTDDLLNKVINTSKPVTDNCKKYFNLLKVNADLHYENTQLKIEMSRIILCNIVLNSTSESQCKVVEPKNLYISQPNEKPVNNRIKRQTHITHHIPHCPRKVKKVGHKMFSPHFMRRIVCHNSDTCLVRNK